MSATAGPFSLEFSEPTGPREFETIDALLEWVIAESKVWAFLSTPNDRIGGSKSHLNKRYYEPIQNAVKLCREAKNAIDLGDIDASKSSLERMAVALKAVFVERRLPLPGSAEREFVAALRDRGPDLAVGAIFYMLEGRADSPASERAVGVIEARRFLGEWNEGDSAYTESLRGLQAQYEGVLSGDRSEIAVLVGEHRRAIDTLKSREERGRSSLAKWLKGERSSWARIKADTLQAFDAVNAAYNEQMTLRGPVEYWSTKRKHHWIYSAVLAVLLAIGGVWGTVSLWGWSMSVLQQGARPGSPDPRAWEIGSVVVVLLLFLWVLRLFVRLMLSQIHLALDSDERVVMAKTFLALVNDPIAGSETDRQLILQALFRNTQTGLVKDDALPPSILAAASKLLSGSGKPGSG